MTASAAFTPRYAWRTYLVVMVVGALLAGVTAGRTPQFGLATILLMVTLVVCVARPLMGLVAIVFFALVGDIVTVYWWPFTKNFSSHESIMFVSTSLGVSPLELTLIATFLGAVGQHLRGCAWPFTRSSLTMPLYGFLAFIAFGFVHGVTRGGNSQVALIELRPFVYLFAMFLLTVALCRTAAHYRCLLWTAVAAIELHALISLQFFSTLDAAELEAKESIMEHGAALRMNLLFLLAIAALIVHKCSVRMRVVLVLLCVAPLSVYLTTQRRAAIVALGTALILLMMIVAWRQRSTFWKLGPIALLLLTGYVGAFWNSTSSAGFPAQAVKSVIAPSQLSERDQSSDQYRVVENFDLHYTIKTSKVLGYGFGQPFLRPIPLADISKFEFFQYISHNSVLWMWVNAGFGGFVMMLYLFSRSIILGARRIRIVADGTDVWALTGAVGFVVMFAVFAYVDIAWDARNMIMLAVSMAMCANYPVQTAQRPLKAEYVAEPSERTTTSVPA